MPRNRHAAAFGRSAAAATKAGADVATTLAFRLPLLFAVPSLSSALEWQRAVTEKMAAASMGAVGAGAACQALALRAAAGRVPAEAMAAEVLAIADAALAPGYLTVAANARRLSKAGRG